MIRMRKVKSVPLHTTPSFNLLTQCRSITTPRSPSGSDQPPSNQSNNQTTKENDWEKFLPTAKQLIDCFGAFYNRSTDLSAANRWEELRAQGYRPVKRSKVNFRWWHEERQRGRIQPDHEQSYPLFIPQSYANQQSIPTNAEKQHSSLPTTLDQRRHLTTSATSQRRSQDKPHKPIQKNSSHVLHKHSPDIINVAGDAASFQTPDLDYTSLDSDSEPGSALCRHLGESPGAKGFRGLKPGSLLELRRTNQSELGILVQTQGNGVVYVNRAGEVRLSILDNVMYTIHGIVPEELALRTYDENLVIEGLNDAATAASTLELEPEEMASRREVLLNARRDCCRALRTLEKKLDKSHSILTQAGSFNLYYKFKHSDPLKSAHMTSEQGVEDLLGQQYAGDEVMVFALHQQLMANADMFLANTREMRDGSSFLLQPFHTLTALYTVREWIAQNSAPLKMFVEKCKTTIQAHRSQQASTNPDAPFSYALLTFAQWTPTDCMFIEVFRTIAINQRMIQDQPYSAIAAYILKQIGLYDSEAMAKTWPSLTFDRFGAITLLRDLGILPAWQSVGLWNPDLDLTERISQQLKTQAQLSSHSKSATENPPSTPLPPTPAPRSTGTGTSRRNPVVLSDDPADTLRHDFGDLPVYIIDDPSAQELDDGISIESINHETRQAWVHVHIADPTAHLNPSDEIALQARAYLDTVYLPGFTLPMLPTSLVQSHRMSLGSRDKSNGKVGQKTLSFSARIDEKGDILEYKVRPGWINNTKQVTYQVITEILDGPKYSDQARVLHIGPNADESFSTRQSYALSLEELDQDDRRRIEQLGSISRILTKKRVDDGAMGWHLPMAQVSIQPNPIVSPSLGIPLAPRIMVGTPSLSISLPAEISDYKNHSWGMSSAQGLVSEMMIMAGRLAGRFYVDESGRNQEEFKLAFRSQPPPDLIGSAQNQEALKELRKQIDPRTGLLSPFKFQKSRIMFMPAVNGLEPTNHFPLGINDKFGYCKVTSPLRRYSDLVAHWQIKNALLRSQDKKTYRDEKRVLSSEGMKELINRLDRDTKPMINLDRKMNLSWMCYTLRRIIKDQNVTSKSIKIQGGSAMGGITEMDFVDLVNDNLTAIILQDPVLMRFTNRWSFKTYIPELGLRASLIVDHVQDWFSSWVDDDQIRNRNPRSQSLSNSSSDHDPIGLRLPVKIVYINPEDHLILRLDSNRHNFVIQSTV